MSEKKERPGDRIDHAITEPKVMPAPASEPTASFCDHDIAQQIHEQSEPGHDAKYGYIVVDGDKARFFYYCAESRRWHHVPWDSPNNLTGPGERCCSSDQIILEPIGEADDVIREAIDSDRPPPGSPIEWNRGPRAGGAYAMREGIAMLQDTIDAWKRNGPSGFLDEGLGRLRLIATLLMACAMLDRVQKDGYGVVRKFDVLNVMLLMTDLGLMPEQAVARLFPRWAAAHGIAAE